ncbi:glycosyltransferase [Paenibacillus nanensis]|uniref:Glycosyltransferase n=1 Tax=Paenibacillus nanensis TaxID=393251 RepID=A0A3A1UXM5_9BACL|nr:glycosyltransferase [Paenibacillus nanensis]RIX52456.1 glycosyltransferase [Paenibacillus nanensis]
MKICKLIRRHSFLDVRVFQKEARSLAALGHEVVVMAPRFDGRLLDVNRSPLRNTEFKPEAFMHHGVHVVTYRARIAPPNPKAMLQDIYGGTLHYRLDALMDKAIGIGADVYHAHEPETLYEAVQAKRALRKQGKDVKVVFDAHELEADTSLLRALMQETDRLITVSDSIASIYASRYPQVPVTLIYNSPRLGADPSKEAAPPPFSAERPFTIGYEGQITREKGNPYRMLDILNKMTDAGLHVRFKILGKIMITVNSERMNLERQFKADPRIEYGWASYDSLGEQWNDVDAGFIYFKLNTPNRKYALPNKLFSLMNSGVPIVVNDAPAMGAVINKAECGIVIPNPLPSADAYAEQFAKLYHDRELLAAMGRRARAVMQEEYGWERMEERLKTLYEGLS